MVVAAPGRFFSCGRAVQSSCWAPCSPHSDPCERVPARAQESSTVGRGFVPLHPASPAAVDPAPTVEHLLGSCARPSLRAWVLPEWGWGYILNGGVNQVFQDCTRPPG